MMGRRRAVAYFGDAAKEITAEKLVCIRIEATGAPFVLLMHDVFCSRRDWEPEGSGLDDQWWRERSGKRS
jgi:hypothetical protein